MRTFSNDFFDSLSGIRELNILVKYKDKNGTMLLTSEANEKLLTEDGDFIGTETGDTTYNEETIKNAFPKFNVNLFSTVCKMATIESLIRLEKGNKFNLKIGVKVGQDFEYMNYGDYVIIDEPTYNADTETYTIVGYDRMIESSVLYDDDPLEITYPITHRNMIKAICDKFNWSMPKVSYTNQNKTIESDIYYGQRMTYRDILDDLLKGTGAILYFDMSSNLTIKYPDFEISHEIDSEYLKDTNVQIKEKFGPVNSIEVITSDGAVLNAIKDNQSIEENGEHKLQLNSLLLQNYSNTYLTDLFNKVKGLEYYIYDFDTIGQLIYEPLDTIEITIGEDTYPSLVLNDEIKLTDGLEETMYADVPNTAENDFIVITDEDKKINDAFIKINKANGQIVLKATSDGNIVQAELNASAEGGSAFNVKADNINFEGATINLTANDMSIMSTNFSVDKDGNMECNNATMNNGNFSGLIEITDDAIGTYTNAKIYTHTSDNAKKCNVYPDGIDFQIGSLTTTGSRGIFTGINYDGPYETNYFTLSTSMLNSSKGIATQTEVRPKQIELKRWYNNRQSSVRTLITPDGIETPVLTQTSLKESKKNFEKFNNALDLIKNIDIYKYNLKGEVDGVKKHIGFVIGDDFNYSKEVTSNENNAVDLYSFVSLCCQGIKEQQEQIEELKKEIKSLKGDGE